MFGSSVRGQATFLLESEEDLCEKSKQKGIFSLLIFNRMYATLVFSFLCAALRIFSNLNILVAILRVKIPLK